jgi:hypothetical protein
MAGSIKMTYPLLQFEGEGLTMRADDLDHKELLQLDPEGGVIRFAGQRALLLDAVAMGLLRKYLVENFGLTAARTNRRRRATAPARPPARRSPRARNVVRL